jgi:prophage DNA circulation protein
MTQADLNEATSSLQQMLDAINAVAIDSTSSAAGLLRQATGSLRAGAASAIIAANVGSSLVNVFMQLRLAGASFLAVDAIRAQALALAPVSAIAGVIVDAVMLQALVCECRILTDFTFTSRDQVDEYRAALDGGFDAAIDKAADELDQVTMQTLISLRAASMRDLSARALPLPQIIAFAYAKRRPALWIAQRLYADGSRYTELVAENGVVHPLFTPATGRALSR